VSMTLVHVQNLDRTMIRCSRPNLDTQRGLSSTKGTTHLMERPCKQQHNKHSLVTKPSFACVSQQEEKHSRYKRVETLETRHRSTRSPFMKQPAKNRKSSSCSCSRTAPTTTEPIYPTKNPTNQNQ
jgi:hypothetical protein